MTLSTLVSFALWACTNRITQLFLLLARPSQHVFILPLIPWMMEHRSSIGILCYNLCFMASQLFVLSQLASWSLVTYLSVCPRTYLFESVLVHTYRVVISSHF